MIWLLLLLFVFSLWALGVSWLLYQHAKVLKNMVEIVKGHQDAMESFTKVIFLLGKKEFEE